MDSKSGAVYSLAGDVYIKKVSLKKTIIRTMIVLVMIGLALYPFIRYLIVPPKANPGLYIQIPLASLPEGTSQLIVYRGQPVMVINNHGNIKALSALCTYANSLLTWDKKREELVCSAHGARFDLNGNVKAGLAPRPLEQIKVRVVKGNIIIGGL